MTPRTLEAEVTEVLSTCALVEPFPGAASVGVGDRLTLGPEIGSGGFGTVRACTAASGRPMGGTIAKRHDGNQVTPAIDGANVLIALHRAITPAARSCWPAVPFWVGRCWWGGTECIVSLAADLTALGFEPFEAVVEDGARMRDWVRAPLSDRHAVARTLARAARAAEEVGFVHADINVENTFVDLAQGRAALIDFDSGWLPGAPTSGPSTWGRADDFVAPEVRGGGTIDCSRLGALSDRWSVGVLLHYLLFGVGPLFFLRSVSDADVRSYLSQHTWPDVDTGSPLFNQPNRAFYASYLQDLADLPHEVADLFRQLVTDGQDDPATRPAAAAWADALTTTAAPPHFASVTTSAAATVAGRPIRVAWSAPGASSVLVDGTGPHPADGRIEVDLGRSRSIVLVAENAFGRVEHRTSVIAVHQGPRIVRLEVPPASIRTPPGWLRLPLSTAPPVPAVPHPPVGTWPVGTRVQLPAAGAWPSTGRRAPARLRLPALRRPGPGT